VPPPSPQVNRLLHDKAALVTRLKVLNDEAEASKQPGGSGGQQTEQFQMQYSQVGGADGSSRAGRPWKPGRSVRAQVALEPDMQPHTAAAFIVLGISL